jgi:p-hydroxybenzoate 3-monooxygenase
MAGKQQVGIVGAGPAGLLLAHLLARRGIGSRVLERSSREHVESRIRAGVLEQSTVDALHAAGLGERLAREGEVHHGIELRFGGSAHRIDFEALVPGHNITVYGQREVVRDLIAARLGDRQAGPEHLSFEVSDVELAGLSAEQPELSYRSGGECHSFACDWWWAAMAITASRATGFRPAAAGSSCGSFRARGSGCWRRFDLPPKN